MVTENVQGTTKVQLNYRDNTEMSFSPPLCFSSPSSPLTSESDTPRHCECLLYLLSLVHVEHILFLWH